MTKGEQTKRFIVEQAATVFNTKGISGTSYADILAQTKLSKGTHFVHFKDKNELAGAVVDYCLDALDDKLMGYIAPYTTAKEKLFGIIDFFSSPNTPPVKGGCPMLNFGTEADDTHEAIRIKIHNSINKGQKLFIEIIEKGIEAKEFHADWDAKEFSVLMLAMIEGGQLLARVSKDDQQMKIITTHIKKMIDEKSY